MFIGSYTRDGRGRGTGVTVWDRDPASGALRPAAPAVPVPEASYLAAHPTRPVLYAVSERDEGQVVALALNPDGTAYELNRQPTGGADPCHLAVDPSGRYLATANYTGGSLSVHPIGDDGSLLPRRDLVRHIGGGPVPDRQDAPHVHMVGFTDDYLLAVDLGNDTVRTYGLSARDGHLRPLHVTHLPPGTGPRHLALTSDLAYLVGELSGTLSTLRTTPDGRLTPLSTVPLSTDPTPNLAAAIAIAPDARHIYTSNRGPNTISIFEPTPQGVTHIAELPSGGQGPRDITLIGDHLYAANEHSDRVTIFDRDPETGLLKQTTSVEVPSPVCVLPGV